MNLRDFLDSAHNNFIPDKQQVLQQILKKGTFSRKKVFMKALIITLSTVIVLGLAAFAFAFLYLRHDTTVNILGDAANLSKIVAVSPTKETSNGVCTDTAVKIVTKDTMSEQDLKKHLAISPACDYKIIKTGSNRFSLRFLDELQNNTIYTISSLVNETAVYRWALQTETSFGITQVINTENSLEFTFSDSNVMGFEQAFSITPNVNGHFLHKGRVWVFIPDTPFAEQVLYNVTIDKEIGGPDGQPLQENYNYRFVGHQADGTYAHILHEGFDISDTFLTTEAPIAQIETNIKIGNSAEIELFKFDNVSTYQAFHAKYAQQYGVTADAALSLSNSGENGLQAYHRFTTTFVRGAEQTSYFLYYPKALPAGYYVARIEFGDTTLYQLLQSSDYAVYTITTNGDYSVWVNSASSGGAVSNALIQADDISVTTDADGLASFKVTDPKKADGRYLLIGADQPTPYVTYIENTTEDPEILRKKQFYSHLYLSSSVYKRNDTVKFWGLALPKDPNSAKPNGFTIYSSWDDKETPITTEKDNSFSGELKLQNLLSQNHGYVELRLDGTVLCSSYFSVNNYTLPLYNATAALEKTAFFYDEPININVSATYSTGMVAADLPIKSTLDGTVVTTDADGKAAFTVTPSLAQNSENICSWEPFYIGYDFTLGEEIDASRISSHPTLQFFNKVMVQGEFIEGNNSYSLKISTHQIDVTKLNQSTIAPYEYVTPDRYIGAPISVATTIEVHEVTYDRKQVGVPSYDPINKKMMYNYEYIRNDKIIETKSVQTQNGIALINDLAYFSNDEKTYYYKLSVTEADGRLSFITLYPTNESFAFCDYVYNLQVQNNEFKENQDVEFVLYNNKRPADVHGGCLLVTEVQNGILNNSFVTKNEFSLTSTKDWLPDMCVYGAYFDGKHIYRVGYAYLRYDFSEKELSVTVKPDKESYQPGDTVALSLEIANSAGAPVQSSYNINIMDTSLLQYADHQDHLMDNLYQSNCWYSEVYTAASYRNFASELGFGEGGGGSGEWRGKFNDNPAFLCGKTDENGHATVEFTLPDNVTTWVIQAQAADQNAYAGSAIKEIVSSLPFTTYAVVPSAVKTSDDLSIAIKSVAENLIADQVVTHTVSILSGEKVLQKQQITSNGTQYGYATFSTLPVGSYSVQIESSWAGYVDKVTYPVTVQNTSLGGYFMSLNDIQGSAKPFADILEENAQLFIYDSKRSQFVAALHKLKNAIGNRLDQKIAVAYATALMQDVSGKTLHDQDWSFMEAHNATSVGYSLFLENEQSDLLLNVKLAMVAKNLCNTEDLAYYFDYVISQQTAANDDILLAYIGKAALGEPVLHDLRYFYGTGESLTTEQRIYLALGFAYSGDYTTAYNIYNQYIRSQISVKDDAAYLSMASSEETEKITGFVLMLASKIHAAEAEKLANYVIQNEQTEVALLLDLISYLTWYPADESENQIVISYADGTKETIAYKKYDIYHRIIDKTTLSEITITEKSGESILSVGGFMALQEIQTVGTAMEGAINIDIPVKATLGERISIDVSIQPTKEIFELTNAYVKLPAGFRLTGNHTIDETQGAISYSPSFEEIYIQLYQMSPVQFSIESVAALPGHYTMEPVLLLYNDQYLKSSAAEILVSSPTTP